MVRDLVRHNTLTVHQTVNQFYYMQKAEELKLLQAQLEETQKKLELIQKRIYEHYLETYHKWRRDALWLNRFLLRRTGK